MATAKKTTTAKKTVKKPTKVTLPEKYTASTIIDYVATKNEIPKTQAKQIIEDLFEVIQAGVMKGERVPIGTIGKAYVKIRPATKARPGRNPLTGEEIMIKAKPATRVPKFTFTKAFKEASLKAKVKKTK